MIGFNPSQRIENPEFLFGRNKSNQLLDQLRISVLRSTNCQLLGERRSGKTSLLYCLKNKISVDHKEYICIYIDWKRENQILNNSNVHRFLIAKCITELTARKIFESEIDLNGEIIEPSTTTDDTFLKLIGISDQKIQGLLEELILTFSEMFEISFVFLFDEFEHLFLKNLSSPQGFYIIRDISERPSIGSYHPLTFVVAGATSREKLASQAGSPEWNTIGCSDFIVSPLSETDFNEMWDYHISSLGESSAKLFQDNNHYYQLSGGIPFYAKVIGQTILSQMKEPDFYALKNNFEDVYHNLSGSEYDLVKSIVNGEKLRNRTPSLENLGQRGILGYNGSHYKINGVLFEQYLVYKFSTLESSTIDKHVIIRNKAEKVEDLIYLINQNVINQIKPEIFTCSNDDTNNYKKIQKCALGKEDFEGFAGALYQILFERTKREVGSGKKKKRKVALESLPIHLKDRTQFQVIAIIDSLRHNFGGHSTNLPTYTPTRNQLKRGALLSLLKGSTSEPKSDEFYIMQEKVLDMFISYLQVLETNLR